MKININIIIFFFAIIVAIIFFFAFNRNYGYVFKYISKNFNTKFYKTSKTVICFILVYTIFYIMDKGSCLLIFNFILMLISQIKELLFYKNMKVLENGIEEILSKNSILNPFNFFENLDVFEKIALSLLFSNYVIISSLISIVYIFYGDILIEKFKLEQRFPKLAKLINLRRKFQRYYLMLSVLFILMSSLSQILFCLIILSL